MRPLDEQNFLGNPGRIRRCRTELYESLAAECWAWDSEDDPLPGKIPEILQNLSRLVNYLN